MFNIQKQSEKILYNKCEMTNQIRWHKKHLTLANRFIVEVTFIRWTELTVDPKSLR